MKYIQKFYSEKQLEKQKYYYCDQIANFMLKLFKEVGYDAVIDIDADEENETWVSINNENRNSIKISPVLSSRKKIITNITEIEFWHDANSLEKDLIIAFIEKNSKEYSKMEHGWISTIYISNEETNEFITKLLSHKNEIENIKLSLATKKFNL